VLYIQSGARQDIAFHRHPSSTTIPQPVDPAKLTSFGLKPPVWVRPVTMFLMWRRIYRWYRMLTVAAVGSMVFA
jgi:hypothetical protein